MQRRCVLFIAPLVLAACLDRSPEPVGVQQPPLPAAGALAQVSQDITPDQMAVAQVVPGFGGYFLDGSGAPTVYLTDPSRRPEAEQALAGFLESRGFTAADLRVRQGGYSYLELDAWYQQAWPQALAVDGAVFSDLDEGSNRLRFGAVDAAAVASVSAALAQLDIPSSAIIVEQTGAIERVATLRDRIRPLQGGLQINFFPSPVSPVTLVCTLGFNAIDGGVSSFITNSHCTNVQGGTETPTDYFQPLRGTPPNPDNFIGVEAEDPDYSFTLCTETDPTFTGFRCRFSDASRAAYAQGVPSNLGQIARPAARNREQGTLEIDRSHPFFSIIAEQANPVQGEEANKVGRTTGWTFGPITATCINSRVLGTNIVQLCQSRVRAGVAGGDSGSPVFGSRRGSLGNGKVILLGILWGSSVGGGQVTFVFSPMSGIERELGALQTF